MWHYQYKKYRGLNTNQATVSFIKYKLGGPITLFTLHFSSLLILEKLNMCPLDFFKIYLNQKCLQHRPVCYFGIKFRRKAILNEFAHLLGSTVLNSPHFSGRLSLSHLCLEKSLHSKAISQCVISPLLLFTSPWFNRSKSYPLLFFRSREQIYCQTPH